MRLNRRGRVRLALVSLLSLLFMQLSVAAYACSGLAEMGHGQPAMAENAMPDCEGMDEEQLALCHAHCHGQSASAHVSVPPPVALPGVDLIGTAVFVASLRPVLDSDPSSPEVRARLTAPPIPVLNCCFRN